MWLARNYQVDGVIWASVIVKAVQALFLYLVIRPYFKFSMNIFKMLVLPIGFVSGTIVLWQWSGQYNWMMYGLLMIVSVVAIAVVYNKEIRLTLNKFAQRKQA
jgi:hypothetical protein